MADQPDKKRAARTDDIPDPPAPPADPKRDPVAEFIRPRDHLVRPLGFGRTQATRLGAAELDSDYSDAMFAKGSDLSGDKPNRGHMPGTESVGKVSDRLKGGQGLFHVPGTSMTLPMGAVQELAKKPTGATADAERKLDMGVMHAALGADKARPLSQKQIDRLEERIDSPSGVQGPYPVRPGPAAQSATAGMMGTSRVSTPQAREYSPQELQAIADKMMAQIRAQHETVQPRGYAGQLQGLDRQTPAPWLDEYMKKEKKKSP